MSHNIDKYREMLLSEKLRYNEAGKNQLKSLLADKKVKDVRTLMQEYNSIFLGGTERGHLFRKIIDLIGPQTLHGKKVLDYCCGVADYGIIYDYFGAEVHGFDISDIAVKYQNESSRLRGGVENFVQMNAIDLGYLDNTFDYVIGLAVLHHVVKYGNRIGAEIQRVLKPGGQAFFAEHLSHNALIEIFRWPLRLRANLRGQGERMFRYREILAIGRPFSEVKTYEFSLVFMVKRFFRGKFNNTNISLLKKVYELDRRLLANYPWLRRYCGEVIIRYTK